MNTFENASKFSQRSIISRYTQLVECYHNCDDMKHGMLEDLSESVHGFAYEVINKIFHRKLSALHSGVKVH